MANEGLWSRASLWSPQKCIDFSLGSTPLVTRDAASHWVTSAGLPNNLFRENFTGIQLGRGVHSLHYPLPTQNIHHFWVSQEISTWYIYIYIKVYIYIYGGWCLRVPSQVFFPTTVLPMNFQLHWWQAGDMDLGRFLQAQPRPPGARVALLKAWSTWDSGKNAILKTDTVDGNQKSGINSPVGGKGSLTSHYLEGFIYIQTVVFLPDFWSINSSSHLKSGMVGWLDPPFWGMASGGHVRFLGGV